MDELGIECESLEMVYVEVCEAIPALAADLMREGKNPLNASYTITNGRLTLLEIPSTELLDPAKPAQGRARPG